MSMKTRMVAEYGSAAMRKPISRGELYEALDALVEAANARKAEIADLKAELAKVKAAPIRYRGVYQRADTYRAGAVVTDGGSAWHAHRDIAAGERPGRSESWVLMVKCGRDGKDAK